MREGRKGRKEEGREEGKKEEKEERKPPSGQRHGLQGRWSGQLRQGDGFRVFSWDPVAYSD